MTNKEADRIIAGYKPHEGFYDLSTKPKSLTKIEYAKVLRIQEYIAGRVVNVDYLKKYVPVLHQKLVELSAGYQFIIREHWGWDDGL